MCSLCCFNHSLNRGEWKKRTKKNKKQGANPESFFLFFFTFDVSLACDLSRCAGTHGVEVTLPALAFLHLTAFPHTSPPHALAPLQRAHAGLQLRVLPDRTQNRREVFVTSKHWFKVRVTACVCVCFVLPSFLFQERHTPEF